VAEVIVTSDPAADCESLNDAWRYDVAVDLQGAIRSAVLAGGRAHVVFGAAE
jgi:hypothetical protein